MRDNDYDAADELLALLRAAAVPVRAPSPELRARVMQRGVPPAFTFLRRDQGIWLPSPDAPIASKALYRDSDDRHATRLIRLQPGERVPPPELMGDRWVVVVSGALTNGHMTVHPRDLIRGASTDAWRATAVTEVLDASCAAPEGTNSGVQWAERTAQVPLGPGVVLRPLNGGGAMPQLSLVEATGAGVLAPHRHEGIEELFVLEGSCLVEGTEMCAGDYHRARDHSTHGATTAGADGCVLFCSVR